MIYNQIVTWTAFAILAMFQYMVDKTTTKDVEIKMSNFSVMFAIFGQGLEGIFGAKLVQNFNPSALHVSMSSTSNTTYVINIDLLAICILLYCKQ